MSLPRFSASDERAMYREDRAGWLEYAAPRIAEVMNRTGSDRLLGLSWSLLKHDGKRAVWRYLDEATRERLRALRKGDKDHG